MEAPEPRSWQEEVRELQGFLDRAGLGRNDELRSALRELLGQVQAEALADEIRGVITSIDGYRPTGITIRTDRSDFAFDDIDGIHSNVTLYMPLLTPIFDASVGAGWDDADQATAALRIRSVLESADREVPRFNERIGSSPQAASDARDLAALISNFAERVDERSNIYASDLAYGKWVDLADAAESIATCETVQRLRVEQLLREAHLLGAATAFLLNGVVNAWSAPGLDDEADHLWALTAARLLEGLNECFDHARAMFGDRAPARVDAATKPEVVDSVWDAFQGATSAAARD
jgi:hypothetical protein